jgi:hypothetical protein
VAPFESTHELIPGPPLPSLQEKLVETASPTLYVWPSCGEAIVAVGAPGTTVYVTVDCEVWPSALVAVTVSEYVPGVDVESVVGLADPLESVQAVSPGPLAPSAQLNVSAADWATVNAWPFCGAEIDTIGAAGTVGPITWLFALVLWFSLSFAVTTTLM